MSLCTFGLYILSFHNEESHLIQLSWSSSRKKHNVVCTEKSFHKTPFSNTNTPVHNDKCNKHVWDEAVAMEMSAAKLKRLIIIISEKQNSQTGESFGRKRCLDSICNLGKGEVRQAVNTIVQDYEMGGITRHVKLQVKSLNKYHFLKNGVKVIGEEKKRFPFLNFSRLM